jgi:hypothetical protein
MSIFHKLFIHKTHFFSSIATQRRQRIIKLAAESNVNYSSKFNIVLIHIPKTGGTSLGKVLELPRQSHQTFAEFEVTEFHNQIAQVKTIAVTRNPIERFISLYNYARMPVSYYHNNLEPFKALYGCHADYRLLMNSSIDQAAEHLIEGRLKHDKSWLHWNPQVFWLTKKSGVGLGVNHVIKLEELGMQLPNLLRSYEFKIPRCNQSQWGTDLKLSGRTKSILAEYYAPDFEYLGYQKNE